MMDQQKEASQLKGVDHDLVRLIENKLCNESGWAGCQASSILTKNVLTELLNCFQELEPNSRLKIIQSLIRLSPKMIETLKEGLTNLVELARRDADDWVEIIADIYRNFPENLSLETTSSWTEAYLNICAEGLTKILNAFEQQFPSVLPPCSATFSHRSNQVKYGFAEVDLKPHFNQKPNTKFDNLLADVRKSTDHQKNPVTRKNGVISSIPIKMRSTAKMENDLPMKGLPTLSSAKIFGGFSNEPKKFQRTLVKREGGAVLLNIDDIPSKKRRRSLRNSTVQNKDSDITDDIADVSDGQSQSLQALDLEPSSQNDDCFTSTVYNGMTDFEMKFPDQLKEFEPLFKDANKLTQRSFAIILSFLGGNKENPMADEHGHIVTLPISEHMVPISEDEHMGQNTENMSIVETYFQMDYQTHAWKRLRKTRKPETGF